MTRGSKEGTMNLDFHSEQALAGAREFRQAQHAQRSYTQPFNSRGPDEPLTAPSPEPPATQRQHAA